MDALALEWKLLKVEQQKRLLYDVNPQEIKFPSASTNLNAQHPMHGIKLDGKEGVGYCSKWGETVAFHDVTGQTIPEINWYQEQQGVCLHCLSPFKGLPFGFPISVDKSPLSNDIRGKTIWGLAGGVFGSVGCALKYADEHRLSFAQESGGLMLLMLLRAYGLKPERYSSIVIPPERVKLPGFDPTITTLNKPFDGIAFHQQLNAPLQLLAPSKQHHYFAREHSALLVDAQVHREKLSCNAKELRQRFPTLYTRPHIGQITYPLPPLFSS